MVWVGKKRGLWLAICLAWAGTALAQQTAPISDAERAKRDAAKVFSFIKFHTVKPAAAAAAPAPKPAARPAPVAAARPSASQLAAAAPRPAATAPAPAAVVAPPPASETSTSSEPVATRSLEPAAPPPQEAPASAAVPVNTLPPAASEPTPASATVAPEPAPEPEPEEVPLKLEHYVPPEMTRLVLDAIGNRDHVVPIRFTVEADGTVSKAEPREGANRRLGIAAARAVQQWRFGPLPERRVVDVELLFRADGEE